MAPIEEEGWQGRMSDRQLTCVELKVLLVWTKFEYVCGLTKKKLATGF